MPVERLRSRAMPPADASNAVDPKDIQALNARLSDRRRERREQRLKQKRKGSKKGGASSKNAGASSRRRSGLYRAKQLPYALGIGALLVCWILGFFFLARRTHTLSSSASHDLSGLNSRTRSALRFVDHLADGVKRRLPKNPVVRGNPDHVIDMRDLNAELVFDNKDGGAWKQGWDVQPVPIGKGHPPLRVFVVPHSHCDPGWIKTFDEYFRSQTKGILSSVVEALEMNPQRKFIWAEISYFEWWWREQTQAKQESFRRLLSSGQFEFVTGGWVQPDEANTQLYAMEIQLQEGHDFIRSTFGEEYIPKFGWSIDPFGYSPTMAYLLKKYGFEGMLIQRVHYRIKKELAQGKNLEFMWRQTWDSQGEYDIFTHVMPFYSYDVPHTCGPDPSVCCQFDFARIRGTTTFADGCPWHKQPKNIHEGNVAERAELLLDQYRKKANLYRSNVVIAPLGDDFRYRTIQEANAQYENYQRIFDYINQKVDGVEISFGTLSEYFEAAMGTFQPPLLKGSFFTYADRDEDYWSGYFTSRIFDKALDRQLERVLYAATSLGATKLDLQEPRRALSLFQHHDGVTGTAKDAVVRDYARKIYSAIGECQNWMVRKLQETKASAPDALSKLQPCWQAEEPRGLTGNLCGDGADALVYNPLETEQSCGTTRVPGRASAKAALPCEVPGAVHNSEAGIQFDPHTGLVVHPVKEEWRSWHVRKGGAYLFFPGRMEDYGETIEIEQGGYVVRTEHWKRTVIEKSNVSNGSTAIVIDFVYETNLQNGNEEWLVRFTGENISNEGVFHTDLNGYNFDTHHYRPDMPIQSQVFPMPTHASVEDQHQRLTILSEHAQGTASLEEGSIDVWLDRRLNQDDERGLAQGVKDNVPTRTRLRVVIEKDGYKHDSPEFEITPFCKRMWKELNHPLEVFARLEEGKVLPLPDLVDDSKKVSTGRKPYTSGRFWVPPVYMVYKRADYLKEAIDSLRDSDFPRHDVPIIISHDGHIQAMVEYVESIKSDFNVIQIFHPHACSEHPDSFPGEDPKLNENYKGDSYGNPRESKITCCKHHFTWLMNQVFGMDEVNEADGFLFMEEDYVVAPTIYETIQTGLDYLEKHGNSKHFGLTFDATEGYSYKPPGKRGWIEKRFVTGPMVFRREMFNRIKENAREYCTFDEYNWDWSIVHLMGVGLLPHLVLVPRQLQVAHIGMEGGLHEDSITSVKQERMKLMQDLKNFHDKPSEIIEFQHNPLKHERGYGGWGHPADHKHCLSLFGNAEEATSGWASALHLK